MTFRDFEIADAKINAQFAEIEGPYDRLRNARRVLHGAVNRVWALSDKCAVLYRGDFSAGYVEVRGRYDFTAKGGNYAVSSPGPGMLSPLELRRLAECKELIATWREGKIPELPPSDVEPSGDYL